MDTFDIALRLIAAALAGVMLGLNRDLHGKPTGVRTLGLVALGSALAVLAIAQGSGVEASRVIQGIVTESVFWAQVLLFAVTKMSRYMDSPQLFASG